MNAEQRQHLIAITKELASTDDRAHDFAHLYRVLCMAERIATEEHADMDVVIPAALWHDIVIYAKNDPRSKEASIHSAAKARELLTGLDWYPQDKIDAVEHAITRCSFSKNLPKDAIEQYIIQDADLLESTGAIAVVRTFTSGAQMNRPFYDLDDPEAKGRAFDAFANSLDLFPSRLFIVPERLYTQTAKKIGKERDAFVRLFYQQFVKEISGQG
ncbi:HD domain-containing protein [Candidatus Gracilibacteria bacterium]|nr:HD domain-containing protein [Candidatus Gracilibacteria bacterium]